MEQILPPSLDVDTFNDSYFKTVTNAVAGLFPVVGRTRDLVVDRVYLTDHKDNSDIAEQRKAIMGEKIWGPKIVVDARIVDKQGVTIGEKKGHFLGRLPQLTNRYSFDVNGAAYKVWNQTRLNSGAYPRVKATGELETHFNLLAGENFRLEIDPQKRKAHISFISNKRKVPLVPVLRALGASDDEIKGALGARMMKENDTPLFDGLRKFHLGAFKKPAEEGEDLIAKTQAFFGATQIRPDTTEFVYGKASTKVDKDLMLRATGRMLEIFRGEAEPVNRDSEAFKDLYDPGHLISDRIKRSYSSRRRQITATIERPDVAGKTGIEKALPKDIIEKPITSFFTTTASSGLSTQLNPITMMNSVLSVSPMGEGGISNPDMIMGDLKNIDMSRTGIIDPIQTPEGDKTGITTFLAHGVRIDGTTPKTVLWNTKSKKLEEVKSMDMIKSTVAFADQYTPDMEPKEKRVQAYGKVGESKLVDAKSVDYVMPIPDVQFSLATNMIPFLPNNQGNRSNMVYRHIEQTIGLKNADIPLVQVRAGNSDKTYEDIVGDKFSVNSPVSGKVIAYDGSTITIQGKGNKKEQVQVYRDFPLNDTKAFLDSRVRVQVGDEVSKGDLLSDTNFTKDGVLTLGTTLAMAVIPFKGFNFEDGYVISESAAAKLTSEHMYTQDIETGGDDYRLDKKAFAQFVPSEARVLEKLSSDGVIRPGQEVEKGDVLVGALKKREWNDEMVDLGKLRGAFKRGLDWKDASLRWEGNHKGRIIDVVRKGGKVKVYVKTEEPAGIGDKIANRHAAKGVIVKILPDREMPRTKDGRPAEILLNPTSVGGRINTSQLNELVLAKVAEKTGQPYAVKNFDQQADYLYVKSHMQTYHTKEGPRKKFKDKYKRKYPESIMDELEKHGMSDTEEMIDPTTGKSLGQVMFGPMYILKQTHQSEKKLSSRGVGPTYDLSAVPKSGGHHGAQAFGELGIYSLLSHGAVSILRGAQTFKGDAAQHDFWTAMQSDEPLPAAKVPFAYEKFATLLGAIGLNLTRDGDQLYLFPSSDEEIIGRSNGEVDPTKVTKGHNADPEKGGIFDEKLTGGKEGSRWTHFGLSREMINPVFEGAVKSILGLKDKELQSLLGVAKAGGTADAPTQGIDDEGNIVPVEEATKTGQDAVIDLLRRVNVSDALVTARDDLNSSKEGGLNKAYRKFRVLRALDEHGVTPEAYIVKNIPVVPPIFRPVTKLPTGALVFDDMNQLYRDIGLLSAQINELPKDFDPKHRLTLEANLYDTMSAFAGTGGEAVYSQIAANPKGVIKRIAGDRPKIGFYQDKLIKRRNDLTLRASIIPDTKLGIDEAGFPEDKLYELLRPMIVRDLVRHGYTPLEARGQIKDRTAAASTALSRTVDEHPILLKRDPSLHKFNILAFKAKPMPGNSIRIHPLVTSGYNADFDGDTMSAYVAVTPDEIEEAKRMYPSNNLFNPANGQVMYYPTLDSQLGGYLYSMWGKDTSRAFSKESDIIEAIEREEIMPTDVIRLGSMKTTGGRVVLSNIIGISPDEMSDPAFSLTPKEMKKKLTEVARAKPSEYGERVNDLKDIGNEFAYRSGFSFSMKDFMTSTDIRDTIVTKYQKQIDDIPDSASEDVQQARLTEISAALDSDLKSKVFKDQLKKGVSSTILFLGAGKPSWAQAKQLTMTPGILPTADGKLQPVVVKNSYGEGVSQGDYYTAAHAVRRGVLDKVHGVRGPGFMSKQMANATVDIVISSDDCGAKDGIILNTTDDTSINRFLAKPVTFKHKGISQTINRGVAVTPALQSQLRAAGVKDIEVRSPLKDQSPHGMCKKCYGLSETGHMPEIGRNVGVQATQAIGERASQLTMRTFHTGGIGSGELASGFKRVNQLLLMPKNLPGKAVLSPVVGVVEDLQTDVETGTGTISIRAMDTNGKPLATIKNIIIPPRSKMMVGVGGKVVLGESLTEGPKDPHDILDTTNDVNQVRGYLTTELSKEFVKHGIDQRQVEIVVKALTNLGTIADSGAHPGWVRGDNVNINQAEDWNKGRSAKDQVQFRPKLVGAGVMPLERTEDFMARMNYQRIKGTILDAAAQGWASNLHGYNPIPGLAYGAEFGHGEEGKY